MKICYEISGRQKPETDPLPPKFARATTPSPPLSEASSRSQKSRSIGKNFAALGVGG